jgi:hypothetical protein
MEPKRELDPALQAIIDTGRYYRWTAITITLGDGVTVLRFARAEQTVGGNTFLGKLDTPTPLKLSLQGQVNDWMSTKAENLDLSLGQELLNVAGALDGATAMVGTLIQSKDGGPVYYDPRVPCDVETGVIDRQWAELPLIAEMYNGLIVGETVASIFPYFQNVQSPALLDPNDIRPPGGGGPGGDLDPGERPGRLPTIDLGGVN